MTRKPHVKLRVMEDMRCLGLGSISGLGSFLAAENSGNNGLDRLRGGAYIQTGGHSLFVPPSDHLSSVDKMRKVHYSDANRHTLHKLDKQAIFPVLRECVSPVGAVEDVVGNQDRV